MRRALTVGLALAAIGMAVTAAPAKMTHDQAKAIAAAKTPAQHEMLAAEFTKQANAARALSSKHDEMATMYKEASSARVHCKQISDNYMKIAQDLDGLAADERELAKGGK
jgi:hypothetical protein